MSKDDQVSGSSTRDDEASNGKKIPYPKAIAFIIGNEFCERFCYYGMRAILVLYFKVILTFSEDTATQAFHIFAMACYFTPILGAIIADSYLGKYWTILSISCIYATGNIVLSLAAINGVEWISFLGLAMIALGTGGIKPCVAAFGGDQFQPGQEKHLQRFFSLFYISINAGSVVSMFLTPILRQDIHCLGRPDCYPLAFGVPAILMIVALLLFIFGKYFAGYIIYPPSKNNVVTSIFSCIFHALSRKFSPNAPKKEHWLDYADDKYNEKTINDIKALMKILFLYIPLPIFWALFDQQASRWTLQAIRLNGKIGSYTFKPDQIQVLNPFIVIFFVPVFDYIVYPLMARCHLDKPLKRMIIGGLLASLSFGVCAILQTQVEKEDPVDLMPGHNHLCVINSGKDTISMNILNSTLVLAPGDMQFFENVLREDLKFPINAEDNEIELVDGKTLIVVFKDSENFLKFLFDNILMKPNITTGKIFSVFSIKGFKDEEFHVSLASHQPKWYEINSDFGGTFVGYLDPMDVEISNELITLKVGTNTLTYPAMGQGSTYLQFIEGDFSQSNQTLNLHLLELVGENRIHILFQLFQYLILSFGEIMFSITGLEFSYSQAPKSMKSVLQAAWLLTVALGNLIVAIIADMKIFEKQSYEFVFFGSLMFVDMMIFATMAYFYVPFKEVKSEEEDTSKLPSYKEVVPMKTMSQPESTSNSHKSEPAKENE